MLSYNVDMRACHNAELSPLINHTSQTRITQVKMPVDSGWSADYINARNEAKSILSIATKVYVEALSQEQYSNMTKNSGRKGIPCLLYIHTDDGTVVLPVPSRASALEPGLLCPRFASSTRSGNNLPVTLYPVQQVDTDNSTSTAIQPTSAQSEPRKPLGYFSKSPVVLVDPIDKLTFEHESGQDFSPTTRFFFRMSASVEDPAGVDVPGKQCVAGWADVRTYLRDTHISPSMERVTESTSFELITKKDKGNRPADKSRKIYAAEIRQSNDGDGDEGPSGSTDRSRGRRMWTEGERSVGALTEEQPQSRKSPLSWRDILNSDAP
jgi:hypothetical protein